MKIFTSARRLFEYEAMFNLQGLSTLSVLDLASGAASFVAEASTLGANAVGVDMLYGLGNDRVDEASRRGLSVATSTVKNDPSLYNFGGQPFADYREYEDARRSAASRFSLHFHSRQSAGRYVAASVTELPFAAKSFDLALMSHLMFVYEESLDLEFHVTSVVESLRVARELRVFPIVGYGEAISRLFGRLRDELPELSFELHDVDYNFLKSTGKMLSIRPKQL